MSTQEIKASFVSFPVVTAAQVATWRRQTLQAHAEYVQKAIAGDARFEMAEIDTMPTQTCIWSKDLVLSHHWRTQQENAQAAVTEMIRQCKGGSSRMRVCVYAQWFDDTITVSVV